MDDLESFGRKLRESLGQDLVEPEVIVVRGDFHKLEGSIVSPTFEGMDEARRQEIVWGCVLRDFETQEWRRIDFLYTNAPSEQSVTI